MNESCRYKNSSAEVSGEEEESMRNGQARYPPHYNWE